jgi:hypothetical protein
MKRAILIVAVLLLAPSFVYSQLYDNEIPKYGGIDGRRSRPTRIENYRIDGPALALTTKQPTTPYDGALPSSRRLTGEWQ